VALEELWNEALKKTEIVLLPIKRLITFGNTQLDYIFLAPSLVNEGDTVVRTGKLDIGRPAIIVPKDAPTFTGFSSEEGSTISDQALQSFFLVRGMSFPSLQYTNEICAVDICEGSVSRASKLYYDRVRRNELISTGIVIGADSSWQFSVLLMGCSLIDTHVENDFKTILERIRKRT